MLFNSLGFAFFLASVLGAYALLQRRGQNRLLLIASYVFYGLWDPRFLGLILLSTVVDYAVALRIHTTPEPRRRKRWLLLSLGTNLGILGLFKYLGFFAEGLTALAGVAGFELEPWALDVVLPVGISFYTFQTLSYTIDVYRGSLEPTRGFLDFALFVAFFPQLVAGPIERASRLLPQVLGERRVTWEGVGSGSWLVLWGTFKKAVIADNLAPLVDAVYAPDAFATAGEIWVATLAFAVQIYCDFSGYTDVARGVARLLGFELMLNFNLPYLATSPADFWRRWHISLSTWLRDYLYVPLGGNRGGRARTYRNLLLTMLLGGLWHGAAWTFVLWGAYHGVLLMVHRAARPWLERLAPQGRAANALWWGLRVAVMFQLTLFGWLLFRAESWAVLERLATSAVDRPGWGGAGDWVRPLVILCLPLVVMQVWQAWRKDLEVVLRAPLVARAGIYAGLFLLLVAMGEDFGTPFLYFQF